MSKRISTCDIVTFSLPNYVNKCMFIKSRGVLSLLDGSVG